MVPSPAHQLDAERGFSAMASVYDELALTHEVVIWLRRRIRETVERGLEPGSKILEINAGSGLDALYFASKGHHVHATDVAPGMLAALAAKAASHEASGRLTCERRSFLDLEGVEGAPYDLVFSNLGGLNCTDDLDRVASALPALLRPGGRIVWVVMPPVCLWELAQALRGHWRTAIRRLGKGGSPANVAGENVPVWYHGRRRLLQSLGPCFEVQSLHSYCLFAPPSFFEGFAERHRTLTRLLMRADDLLGGHAPFSRAGDFIVLEARLRA